MPRAHTRSLVVLASAVVLASCASEPPPPPAVRVGDPSADNDEQPAADTTFAFAVDGATADGSALVVTHDASVGPRTLVVGITNPNETAHTILSDPPILVLGPDEARFTVARAPDVTLPAGETVTFDLLFTPNGPGRREATLLFAWGVASHERSGIDVVVEATGTAQGIGYALYDGSFDLLPDFSTLTPTETGVMPTFDISPRGALAGAAGDFFAYVFEGAVVVPASGSWTFFITSDDGSRLAVDGAELIVNDGLHGPVEKSAVVELTAGPHPIRVDYFEKAGGATLNVEWAGPGVAREAIPTSALVVTP